MVYQENQPRKHRQNFDIFSADRPHIAVHFFRIRLAFVFLGLGWQAEKPFCPGMFWDVRVLIYISVYVHPGMQKEHRSGPGWWKRSKTLTLLMKIFDLLNNAYEWRRSPSMQQAPRIISEQCKNQLCLPGQVASAQPMWGSLIFVALCWYLTCLRVKMAQQSKGKSVKGPHRSLKKLCWINFFYLLYILHTPKYLRKKIE